MILKMLKVDADYRNVDENESYIDDVSNIKERLKLETIDMPVVIKDGAVVGTGFSVDDLAGILASIDENTIH